MLDAGRLGHRRICGRLERERRPSSPPTVGRDEHLGLRVVDPVAQGLRREPSKDNRMRGADAGAGQHGDGQLGDHRQVDVDPIALRHTEVLEDVGQPRDLVEQLRIGDGARVTGLALPVVRDLVAASGHHVTVEAVVGGVELAAHEPLRKGQVPLADAVPTLVPVQCEGLAFPKFQPVVIRLVVEHGPGHEGTPAELLGRRERALLEEIVLDGRSGRLFAHDSP